MNNDEDKEERLQNACKKGKYTNKKRSIEVMMKKPPYVTALPSANDVLVSSIVPQHSSPPPSNTMRYGNQNRRPDSPKKDVAVTNELMLRKMNSIISKLTNIDNRISQLESQYRVRTLTEDINDVDEEINFPIKSIQELEEFEEKLKNNTYVPGKNGTAFFLIYHLICLISTPVNSNCVSVHQQVDTVAKTAKAKNDICWNTIVINARVPIKMSALLNGSHGCH
ncbi:hypothetical protein PV326_011234 [Microctonus aethiopoides]|uniref:Uncharacterized protein n=1 Tax=Microctonus aethiopoides TaxID=144406 RepID=A0AA39KL95_9HYME|nr:hypothetical protein PV326_011234 [Microctonus aethiopoides]KAK0165594.1 hypothetical protein PV328_004098 [Microctonus aethiopoides]